MRAEEPVWKVGELAARTGLTVRTLHHYDAVGLLRPSGRTGSAHGSGHRLYTATDVARLQQILSLKALGFGLDEIRDQLAGAAHDPRRVVRLHRDRARAKAAEFARLADRLDALATALDRAGAVSPDDFLHAITEMTVIEKYYTPEQRNDLRARKDRVGEARIQEVQAEWPRLMAEVGAAMAAGTDPTATEARALARRWFGLVAEFTGGDPGIFRSLKTMYQNEDRVAGMDVVAMRPMMEFMGRAAAAAGIALPQ
ncbi:MAG TPA: MerR family transcriptional regulator [Urbifossiella sp.]|jgi:DNA-binding transcriptional MerR regulator|nr:MerR family transcriptional regulator [Urbifossiella sp.]